MRFRFAPRERACADPHSAYSDIVHTTSVGGRADGLCSSTEAGESLATLG